MPKQIPVFGQQEKEALAKLYNAKVFQKALEIMSAYEPSVFLPASADKDAKADRLHQIQGFRSYELKLLSLIEDEPVKKESGDLPIEYQHPDDEFNQPI